MTRIDNPHNETYFCNNKSCVMYSSGKVDNWRVDELYTMRKLRDEGDTIREIAEKTKTPKSTIWKFLSTDKLEQE